MALIVLSLIAILTISVFSSTAQTNTDSLRVEYEQHYETYLVGGTCIFATHNIALADLDNDGTTEIATGGYTYDLENSTRVNPSAPLKIWSWNDANLTLEASYKWPEAQGRASINCIYAADANGDGVTDLITGGNTFNETGLYAQLRIWRWDGELLTLKTSHEWNNTEGGSSVAAVIVDDADKNGIPEIMTAGRVTDVEANQTMSQLMVWQWNGDELKLLKSTEWCEGTAAAANSLCATDLDNDGKIEIVTAGFNHELKDSRGQIRVWRWNSTDLALQVNQEWQTVENVYALTSAGGVQGNTVVNNVKAADVDNDGMSEIVTAGFTYDGEKVDGELCIWNYTQQVITQEDSFMWTSEDITEAKSITINDIDNDGTTEIVTSGVTAGQSSFNQNSSVTENAQLRVFQWNGTKLVVEHSQDWTIGEGVCAWNVASGDIDKDGTTEIVTVGCMYIANMCDPDLRIWAIAGSIQTPSPTSTALSPPTSSSSTAEVATAATISIVIIAGATIYLVFNKRRA